MICIEHGGVGGVFRYMLVDAEAVGSESAGDV